MTVAPRAPVVDAPDPAAAAALLRDRGYRVSASRRLVLEALYSASEPVSAEEIAAGIGGKLPKSDPASVYRNLETLERLGLVRHFHAGHGPGRYALARDREYVACEVCGECRGLDSSEFDQIRTLIQSRFGVTARFDHFPIVGVCEKCRADNGEGRVST